MPVWTVPAEIIRVVDGDTVRLRLDLGWRIYMDANCRIFGINAPELATAAGVLAKNYAQRLLPEGGRVLFESIELDKYGRPLGTIRDVEGTDFAEEMISAGHAVKIKG